MAKSEWLRTFVAIYRAGSVTEGARQRLLSQPAATQQLGGLERSVGAALFVRTPSGVEPTPRGRELYLEVAAAMDHLDAVLSGLDAGVVPRARPTVRIGCSAEYFSAAVLPHVPRDCAAIAVTFGNDQELLRALDRAEIDLAVTTTPASRRSTASEKFADRRFVLVAPTDRATEPPGSIDELGEALSGRPWVSYSAEIPVTRRFWQSAFGRSFDADVRLVAPDLRAVVNAVALGIGTSLLHAFVCAEALAAGRVVELFPVGDLIAAEPLFICARIGELARPEVAALRDVLAASYEG